MSANRAGGPSGHQEAWELLPWHANGSLAAEEAARVEGHLARCALCRRELEVCRAMASAVDAAGRLPLAAPAGGPPEDREAGAARAQTGPAVPAEAGADGSAADASWMADTRRPGWWSATPRPARRALLALAAVLALVALGLAFLAGRGLPGAAAPGTDAPAAGAFRTLADPAAGNPPAADEVPAVRLVLRDDATAAEVRELLAEVGGEVVAGPSQAGVYTIRLAGLAETPGAVEAVLDRLRRHPAVAFAEPAVARGAGGAGAAGGDR